MTPLRGVRWPHFVAVFLLAAALLSHSMGRRLLHDEHQFVAPGALLVDTSLLPYRDFPYLHMPYLVFVYGLVFQLTDHLLLGARIFSVLCGWLTVVVVFTAAWRALGESGSVRRLLFAAGSAALLMFNPVFIYTDGLAWNHDAGTLLALLGMLVLARALRGGSPRRDAFFAGALLAVAIGIRLSFAPLVVGAGLCMLVLGGRRARPLRWPMLVAGALGALVASLPSLILMAAALQGFLFGNLGYPRLNTDWYTEIGNTKAMTVGGKLTYLRENVLSEPGTVALVLVTLLCVLSLRFLRDGLTGGRSLPGLVCLLALPFLAVGAWAPSPTWYQYYSALIPFMVLVCVYGLAFLARDARRPLALSLLLLAALTAVVDRPRAYRNLGLLLRPDDWGPVRVHRTGQEIARLTGGGRVFTLSPVFPLEGKSRIYSGLATGRFVWRTGHLLSTDERRELGITTLGELPELLATDPPDSILTGSAGGLVGPLARFAKEHSCERVVLRNGDVLYVRPDRAAPPDAR